MPSSATTTATATGPANRRVPILEIAPSRPGNASHSLTSRPVGSGAGHGYRLAGTVGPRGRIRPMALTDRLRFDSSRVRFVRRGRDAIAVGSGVVVVLLGMYAVREGVVSEFEEQIFRAINDLPGFLYAELWPLNQLGVLAIGPI